MSKDDAALKSFLAQGAERYAASGRSVASKEMAAEASAMSNMIGTSRLSELLESEHFARTKSVMGLDSLKSGHIDQILQGNQRPMGMNGERFASLQSSLGALKSKGFTNEEIAGAVRWGRHVRGRS